jgi:Lrp/AsnC family transcriptional regulator
VEPVTLDDVDRRILHWLQRDAAMPVAELAAHAGISASPCWRRVQRLTEAGVIRARVALLDPGRVNAAVNVFVAVRTNQHKASWADAFCAIVTDMPEVVGFYRMAGQIDYLLHVVVPGIDAYDDVYKRLIARIDLYDVSASFAMEVLKTTTALPLDYAPRTSAAR